MSNSEFKARALYDFNAEGPNELSFRANDILTITSNTAGNGWWFAKSYSGQVGVIPENYVQALADPPEPNEPPPPLSTFSNAYPSLDISNGNNNNSKTPYPTSYDHSYMNPSSLNNWQSHETSAWPSSPPQPSQLTSSLQTLNFSTENSFAYTSSVTSNSSDMYISVRDMSPTATVSSVPLMTTNPPIYTNSSTDLFNEWYGVLPNTPAPILTKPNQSSSSFDFPQSQTTTSFDPFAPVSSSINPSYNTNFIDDPIPPANFSTDTPVSSQSRPSISSESASKSSSSPTKIEPPTIANDNTSDLLKKKKRKKLTKFLPLSSKRKNEKEKIPVTEEVSRPSIKRDTDSDDSFSDSEYPSPSPQITNSNAQSQHPTVKRTNTLPSNATLTNQARTSLATAEAPKGPPRARFFDKHGLDNYLLNGCKAKTDEHVEISFDEREGGVYWSPNPGTPPFKCRVEDPAKGTKLGGLKAFMEYKVHPEIPGSRVVGRRYKQFDWLHEQLVNKFRFICIPPLPGKQIAGRFEQEFIEERRRQLELWLNRICRHPVLCASFAVQHFIACEQSDKNKKDWKTGKRRIEKDELREAPWLQCVTLTHTGLSDPQLISQIDTFGQQQPGLETQLKNLSQGLTKYIERHTEVYERDIQRISELFSKVHLAVQVDTTTPGNKDLSNSIFKTSASYNGIAELYKTKASDGLRDFNERIQEYMGLLACFPSILSIQRSGSEFIKTNQQRGTNDFSNAVHRVHVLNHVVLAEINFFQREKVNDLNVYLKTMVDEQIQFYEKVTTELRDASITFK